MTNLKYKRSRAREQKLVNELKEMGWYATRTPGSKSPVDVVALRPTRCGHADHYQVKLIQIKTSEKLTAIKTEYKVVELPFLANIEFIHYPAKTKNHYAKLKLRKAKAGSRVLPAKRVSKRVDTKRANARTTGKHK